MDEKDKFEPATNIEDVVLLFHNTCGVDSDCPGILTGQIAGVLTCAECGAEIAFSELPNGRG